MYRRGNPPQFRKRPAPLRFQGLAFGCLPPNCAELKAAPIRPSPPRENPVNRSSWTQSNTTASRREHVLLYSSIIPVLGWASTYFYNASAEILRPIGSPLPPAWEGHRWKGRSFLAFVDDGLLGIDPEGPDGRADEQQAGGDAERSDPGASADTIYPKTVGESAPTNWPPMFIMPETVPENSPPTSMGTAQAGPMVISRKNIAAVRQ